MATEPTGSQKLVASLIAKGKAASPEEVKQALSIPQSSEYTLLNWFPRGIPPVYRAAEATLEVPQAKLPEAISALAANASVRNINILINGIPAVYKAQITAVLAHEAQE
jgi:hypothetical protein